MSTMVPAKKNTAYTFYTSLVSQANPYIFQANPTLAAGDVKVAVDDAAPANVTDLPTVDADFTKRVKVTLTASEMNGDNITVIFSDVAGDEWCDQVVNIQTTAAQIDEIKSETADIVADTAEIGTAGAGLTAIPWNSAWDAEVQSECADALNSYDPPTKAELDTAEANIRGADNDTLKTLSDQIDGVAPAGEYDTEMSRIDQSLSTTESNIRGTDNDDLKTLSDQLDGLEIFPRTR